MPSGIEPRPSQCVISDHWHGDAVVLRCVGELDTITVPDLERQIASTFQKRPAAAIVDLSDVDFLASCGMGLLMMANEDCPPETAFVVVADGPATSRPMQLLGLTDALSVHATVDQALASLQA